ncbi:MAG TPA: hypothetical protein VK785_10120 [Opitutaceae bacterium]|nr:hypothetical protein [Opitutaceae bacterium]
MPSPDDRLQELRRQHALVQEHLAWLDREIASTAGGAAPAPAIQGQPIVPVADGGDIDALIESYKAEARSTPATVRRGCFFAFAAALLLFFLCVLALYLYIRGHQPSPVR